VVAHEAEQEAIREMVALRAQGKPLRAIGAAMAAKQGVADIVKAAGARLG
jgi:hypothetical protein